MARYGEVHKGYYRKDGSPPRRPKHYYGVWNKENKKYKPRGKKNILSQNGISEKGIHNLKQMRLNYRRGLAIIRRMIKLAWKRRRQREEGVLQDAMNNGTLEELHEMMVAVKSSDLGNKAMELYDKNGQLIPVLNLTKNYDKKLAEELCDKVAEGSSLKELCNGENKLMDIRTARKWYRNIPEFKKALDQAYTDRADYYMDKIYQLMDDVETGRLDPRKATFVADQIKWVAERLHPKFMQKNSKTSINIDADSISDGGINFQIILADNIKTGQNTDDGGTDCIPSE